VGVDGDTLTLNAAGNTIKLGKSDDAANDASAVLGFTDGQSNTLSLTSTLGDINLKTAPGASGTFKINGVEFNFNATTTMRDMMNTINSSSAGVTMSYSSLTDTFVLTSKNTGTGNQITLEDLSGSFTNSVFGTGSFTEGTNAEIRINTNAGATDPNSLTYTTVVKSSNTFEIDGVTYTLLGKASGAAEENIKVSVEYDADSVVSNVKQFVADYNEMLKFVTDKLSETKYKDFPPLTDEQRKELGTTDAALYDEKAKSGLLKNDTYLSSIASNLRNSMYAEIKALNDSSTGIGISLAEIGITTGLYSEKGQLKIDEAKLRSALSQKPDQVVKLFTQKSSVSFSPYTTDKDLITKRYSESGLMYRISDIIQSNTRSITGALTKLVGNSDNDYSSIYALKLRDLDEKIEILQKKLKDRQEYYWMKFSKMESSLSSLNKQSTYLYNSSSQG
jgi:flagellar hook-associated protein 2